MYKSKKRIFSKLISKMRFDSLVLLIFVLAVAVVCQKEQHNVCSSYLEYLGAGDNDRCWYDSDVEGNIISMISRHGFVVEEHEARTEDGYVLTMFRIPAIVNDTRNVEDKTPLVFFHGINRDARCFLLRGHLSPVLHYATMGYDVWLANNRGTEYSKHIKYSKKQKEFWDYSFHEMGIFDIPAVIDKIVQETNKSGQIIYIGHSLGTTISYIYSSLNVTHCKNNVKGIISLAPIGKVNNLKVPFLKLGSEFVYPFSDFLTKLGIHKIVTHIFYPICNYFPLQGVCGFGLQFFSGESSVNIYPEIVPKWTSFGDAPISVKTGAHFGQVLKANGRFAFYNYRKQNMEKYGSPEPPLYPLKQIPVRVELLMANTDKFAVKSDINELIKDLQEYGFQEVPRKGSNIKLAHDDFLHATQEMLFYEIFPTIDKAIYNIKNN